MKEKLSGFLKKISLKIENTDWFFVVLFCIPIIGAGFFEHKNYTKIIGIIMAILIVIMSIVIAEPRQIS